MATVRRVVAPNPGPFTGPGTNTWVVGDDPVKVVIDPGPDNDGDVAAYLRSRDQGAGVRPRMLFPGHWDPVMDPPAKITEYREHRLARERQVMDELRERPGSAEELTQRIYASEVGESEPL